MLIDQRHGMKCKENKTYSKFSNLGIVNAHNLILLGGPETQTRNEVDGQKNEARAQERVGKTANGVSQLVRKLNVVAVEPTTRDNSGTVEMGDIVTESKLESARDR